MNSNSTTPSNACKISDNSQIHLLNQAQINIILIVNSAYCWWFDDGSETKYQQIRIIVIHFRPWTIKSSIWNRQVNDGKLSSKISFLWVYWRIYSIINLIISSIARWCGSSWWVWCWQGSQSWKDLLLIVHAWQFRVFNELESSL